LNVAKRKLDGLNAAGHIKDLLAPPGNRLELLKGDLAGRWSIRINDQFRIVFRWDKESPNPSEVEIRDYH
jgi:proteic killer suppression protein